MVYISILSRQGKENNFMSTPRRLKRSIKKENISGQDYQKYKFLISCEDCSHFSFIHQQCTLGNNTVEHRKEAQTRSYLLSGTVAFCRLIEID